MRIPPRWNNAAAGLTVGTMLVPQSMAYALLAGVPPIYGLYSSIIPLLIYPLIGTSLQLAVGIVAIDMLIVAGAVSDLAPADSPRALELAVLLAGMAGVLQLLFAALRFGRAVRFIRPPVIAGFASAAPILIAASQLPHLFGAQPARSLDISRMLLHVFKEAGSLNYAALLFGAITVLILMLTRRLSPLLPSALICMAAGITVCYLLQPELPIVGRVPLGLPRPELPAADWSDVRRLALPAALLALVQLVNVVTLGRIFARERGYRIRPNREFWAIGAGNLCGMLFHCLPASASFSRTAINAEAGANSPVSNWYAALLVILTVLFFAPLLYYLPTAVLAAIIIHACLNMVEIKQLGFLIRTDRLDGFAAVSAFAATLLLGITNGLAVGIAAGLAAQFFKRRRNGGEPPGK